MYWSTYLDPLGYGKSASRFSDPRRRVAANRFGVLYLGDSLKVCFLETLLRDRREGPFDDLPIDEVELTQRRYAEIATTAELHLVDLRDDNAVRMGVPADVVRAQRQNLARWWSLAFHEHPSKPDGIIYPSRLNGATNLAIYDRSIGKLQAKRVVTLLGAPELGQALDDFKVGLV
ncbi:RES family NAD+ phosphorylase [Mesorhizobium sp. M0296]|uniref:RES family NAD+ phosphorylase n=1 Tax=Mesorhizobium sp. M0296 TaxID=2956931 RepID=UPI00333B9EDD